MKPSQPVYEAPTSEVVVVRTERTILSGGMQSSRASYGAKNYGVNSGELDEDGNWSWD